MAKVLDPLHSQEARGRVGGLVYNTWRGIHTVKTHTDPAHQDDPKRQAHKAIVQAAAIRWQSLTHQQRNAWGAYAREHPQLDWTGAPQRIAGYHWYVRVQTTRQDIGEGYDDDPPTEPNSSTFQWIEAFGSEGAAAVGFIAMEADPGWTGYCDVWLAGPFSAGRSPSIHDARRYTIVDMSEAWANAEPLDAGWYTFFLRAIRNNGLAAPWSKSLAVEVTAPAKAPIPVPRPDRYQPRVP
jgi:hypothetical protein